MLDWFTTIPGILILCGVLLLAIAIILFILGAKKSKKLGNVGTDTNANTTTDLNSSNVVSNENNVINDLSSMNVISDNNVITNNSVSDNGVQSNVNTIEPVVNPVNDADITISPVMEDTNTVVTNDTPAFEMPKMDTTLVDDVKPEVVSIPDVDNTPVEEATNPVYGGATPTYNFTENEKPVTIYGGNDPLEATQTLPKMEEHHLPYGGVNPEDKIDINQVNNIPTPVVENISEMPIVEDTKPVEVTTQENIPVTPVVDIPSMDEQQSVSDNTVSTASVGVTEIPAQDTTSTVEEL